MITAQCKIGWWHATLFILPAIAACGEARKSEPLTGALTLSPDEMRGQEVFYAKCNECHPHGESGIGPALNDKPLPSVAIDAKVRGNLPGGNMPSFGEDIISDDDLDHLTDYLEALRDQ